MQNWDDLRFLVALSKTGTMSGAAKLLGTNTATVSRRIDRLSAYLGTPAFIKTADGWQPSEAIQSLIQISQSFDGRLQSALNAHASEQRHAVQIRIGAVPVVSSQVLMPGLVAQQHMLDGLALTFKDRIFSEGLGDNDLVIQYGLPTSGRLITRKAGSLAFRLFGYDDTRPDSDWAGLTEDHDSYPTMTMSFEYFGKPPRIRVENFTALHTLMRLTRLPGTLPEILAAKDPDFCALEPEKPPFIAEFWIGFHESRRNDPAIKQASAWIVQCFDSQGEGLKHN